MTARIGGKTGGRQKGSLDKNARQLVSGELAHSIMITFQKTGGVAGMIKWVMENNANRTAFYVTILSRLMPAPQKDDADFVQNNQFNIGDMSVMEAGRRVAFALNAGLAAQQDLVAERVPEQPTSPQEALNNWRPADVPDDIELTYSDMPEPVADQKKAPTRKVFIFDENDARSYEDQFRAWDLCRDTVNNTIETYHGGPGEQGGHAPVQRQVVTNHRPTIAEKCRSQAQRRRDQLL